MLLVLSMTCFASGDAEETNMFMNSFWALVPPIEMPKKERKNKKLKNELLAKRSIETLNNFVKNC